MALKAKVANKVQTNKQGLVEGTVTQVLEIDERTEIQKGKEVTYAAQFEFQIEAEGTQKPILYRIWTRQTFNNEKYEKIDETVDYNDFTRLMLQLELINESDLKDLQNPKLASFDVEAVQGLKVVFELEPSKKTNSKGLKVPKLTSIKPLKPTK
ncbi:hypothetical protein [Nostoc sp. 2RC]|uniref:hypothetical protein n=1 Tax=Nostoc sp. 2RC TaxID=2485484 RepID=UPI0016251A2B|nr:hypothetical protein [Nostoc sp. 2RC]MBC1238499.1 hypothetical protein [Nostoc sp. 2RC]